MNWLPNTFFNNCFNFYCSNQYIYIYIYIFVQQYIVNINTDNNICALVVSVWIIIIIYKIWCNEILNIL